MDTTRNTGRLIGALLLLQALCSYFGNIVLLRPALAAPGFLVNAAPNALGVQLAVMAMLAAGALSIAIAVSLWPILRQHGDAAGLWLLALATTNLALTAVECASLLSMLSLSEAFTAADPALAAQYDAVATAVRRSRNWLHYLKLMSGVGMIALLQVMLARLALAPRLLAAAAAVATAVQLVAVTLPVFGSPINFALMTPAGVLFLGLALGLLVRGFSTGPRAPDRAGAVAGQLS